MIPFLFALIPALRRISTWEVDVFIFLSIWSAVFVLLSHRARNRDGGPDRSWAMVLLYLASLPVLYFFLVGVERVMNGTW